MAQKFFEVAPAVEVTRDLVITGGYLYPLILNNKSPLIVNQWVNDVSGHHLNIMSGSKDSDMLCGDMSGMNGRLTGMAFS